MRFSWWAPTLAERHAVDAYVLTCPVYAAVSGNAHTLPVLDDNVLPVSPAPFTWYQAFPFPYALPLPK